MAFPCLSDCLQRHHASHLYARPVLSPTLCCPLMCADADELAAACGMFISPAKPAAAAGAINNKPRKLFSEEEAGSAGRQPLLGGMAAELSPALWVQAA